MDYLQIWSPCWRVWCPVIEIFEDELPDTLIWDPILEQHFHLASAGNLLQIDGKHSVDYLGVYTAGWITSWANINNDQLISKTGIIECKIHRYLTTHRMADQDYILEVQFRYEFQYVAGHGRVIHRGTVC